jgi:hypothetical protein
MARLSFDSLFRRWDPSTRIRVERVGGSWLASRARPDRFLAEYHNTCLGLVREALAEVDVPLDVCFGDVPRPASFEVSRTLRIGLQCEHTLVKPGGRDCGVAPVGGIATLGGDATYLVRIAGFEQLRGFDCVFDYSLPNLANISSCPQFADFMARTVYVAPLMVPQGGPTGGRRGGAVTTFHDPGQPRRKRILDRCQRQDVGVRNVTGIFGARKLEGLYGSVQVLVNVHQTDHHHTLEELRVLPALCCGAIVVSEDVPLRATVPYHRFVIWADYEGIPEAVRDALSNADSHRQRIFGDPELGATLAAIERNNHITVTTVIRKLATMISTREREPGTR